MKKVFNSFFVIIAAMVTFAGCAKQEIDAPATPETKTVQFFANSIETKTAFGTPDGNTYPTLWSKGDKVKVFLNLYSVEGSKTEDVVTVQPSEDLRTATFKSNGINDPATPEYTFYAVSPSTAYKSGSRDADNNCFVVSIPKTQEPTTDASVDPTTQVIYATSSTVDAFPTSVDLSFKHFTAYCKLSFLNINNSLGNDIKSVTVQSDDLNFVGEWKLGLDGNHMPYSETDNDAIHITTNRSENIWFACAPVDVRGKDVTFIVETSKGTATRTVKFPADDERYQFKSGSIAKLKVNMEEAMIDIPETVQYFTKVETTPTDWSGTYLIVYETGKVAFNGNLSTLDAVSNTVPVTIEENKIQYTELLAKSTFVIAKSGDSYSVKSASGYYIGNTSYANALKQNSTEYTHTISLENGDVSLTESNNTTLKFNNTSNQMRFRYYKSGQQNIQLYKLDGSGSEGGEGGETPVDPVQLTMSEITCSEKTENSLTFTWTAVDNATGYEVTINDGTPKVVMSTTYEATDLTPGTEYTISVKAIGDGTNYTTSEAKTQKGTTATQGGETTDPEEPVENMTISVDFESNNYSEWKVTNMLLKQTGTISAKEGTYYGTTGAKESASIATVNTYVSPKSITCYVSKQSSNTNTSSNWNIEVSTDGTTWTAVKTQAAASMNKGAWVEFTADLSAYTNVYVRVSYVGTSAVRNIDALTFTYAN